MLTLLIVMQIQINIIAACISIPLRMTKMKKTDKTKYWQECGATGTFIHCWWNANDTITSQDSW